MQEKILFREEERYFLASYGAILASHPYPALRDSQDALATLVHWVRSFLCANHNHLGREGNVCPYTAPALKKHTLWFTAITDETLSKEDVLAIVELYRQWFLELEPIQDNSNIFKSIIIAFPNIDAEQAPEYIDEVQAALKYNFVREGLMIGQFHQSCPEPGLHNSDFRPLQSPVPLLAIRNMVRTDIPFLAHDEVLMQSYRKIFMN